MKNPWLEKSLSQGFIMKGGKWYLQESNRGHTDFQSDALPTELRHGKWYLQESNRGHTDFQSDALPTELRHHSMFKRSLSLTSRSQFSIAFLSFAGAKVQ